MDLNGSGKSSASGSDQFKRSFGAKFPGGMRTVAITRGRSERWSRRLLQFSLAFVSGFRFHPEQKVGGRQGTANPGLGSGYLLPAEALTKPATAEAYQHYVGANNPARAAGQR